MALNPNELFSSTTRAAALRCQSWSAQGKTFKQGTGTLAALTPVSKNNSTGHYEPWVAIVSEVSTIVGTGTIGGGNFTLTVNGEVTAAIAHNANAAAIQAALLVLGGIDPGDVVVTGGPLSANTDVVLTFGGKLAGTAPAVSVQDSVTGGGSLALNETTAGVAANGADEIAGFVWPDAVVLDTNEEVIGTVCMKGIIHLDDIPLVGTVSLAQLKVGLKANNNVRKLGFTIQGLQGF